VITFFAETGHFILAGAPVLCVLGAIYCIGGLHGLYLAWSQEARMHRWAYRVAQLQTRLNDNEGVPRP